MMTNFKLLSLLSLLPSVLSFGKPPLNKPDFGGVEIIGGTQVNDPTAFPFFASIRENNRAVCGGSVISRHWILTAAHCLFDEMKNATDNSTYYVPTPFQNFTIVVGTVKQHAPNLGHKVSAAIFDSRYNDTDMTYDIALIKLARPLKYNARVRPIRISTMPVTDTDSYTAVGFGVNNVTANSTPETLLKVDIPSSDPANCEKVVPGYKQKELVCAEHENADTCWGDSGGPLLRYEKDQWKVVGLTSFGQNINSGQEGCGGAGDYGYYTHAGAHLDFLTKTTGMTEHQLTDPNSFE